MKHFELKCRLKIKAIASYCLIKKGQAETLWEILLIGKLPAEDWVKKSKNATRERI